jgi:hypothetical protein
VAGGADLDGEGQGAAGGGAGGGAFEPVGAVEDEFEIEAAAAGEAGIVGVVDAEPGLRGFADAGGVEFDDDLAVAEAGADGLAVDEKIFGGGEGADDDDFGAGGMGDEVEDGFGAIEPERAGRGGEAEEGDGGIAADADLVGAKTVSWANMPSFMCSATWQW